MILWSSYDIGSSWGGLLWAESVAAEVIVFVVLGPPIVRSVSSPAVMAIAACAAAARWALSSQATSVSEFALIEPLHGLSFALLHLSCMRIITEVVSPGLLATAQSLYAFAIGASSVVVTLASGWLYARLGAGAFWIMAALPISAAPLIWSLLKAGERQGEQLSSTVVAGMSAPESVMAERSE
jgi:PPP family 3-phenylpropionic acid transporter